MILIALTCLAFCWARMAFVQAEPGMHNEEQKPLLIADLEPKLDGEIVTIQFTVTELGGIAQLSKPGQAPWFAIETDKGTQKNLLAVWIIDELANVLDRLQLSAFQDNAIKPGTVIVATGKLTLHKTISNQYHFDVSRWQDFRILPSKPEK
jgi:hypothetical protein